MKDTSMESGDRGHRDHSKGEGTKADRQGGGPGERSSMAGEQGAKAEDPDNSTRSHTTPGEVHGHGTLKDGSSKDQPAEERGEGTSLHLGDDYRINKVRFLLREAVLNLFQIQFLNYYGKQKQFFRSKQYQPV